MILWDIPVKTAKFSAWNAVENIHARRLSSQTKQESLQERSSISKVKVIGKIKDG